MWTKDGAVILDRVLKQIDRVIPEEVIGQKILVDDNSTDSTVKIAKAHSWHVYPNIQGGVAGGFNEALSRVKTETFFSFEQDVILNAYWFDLIPPHLEDPQTAVCQGVRVPTDPVLRLVYIDKLKNSPYMPVTSLDNTCYKTDIMKELGGFPKTAKHIADSYLVKEVVGAGYLWKVDKKVISFHYRPSIRGQVSHYHKAINRADKQQDLPRLKFKIVVKKFVSGSQRAVRVARQGQPKALLVYPYMSARNLAFWAANRKGVSQ